MVFRRQAKGLPTSKELPSAPLTVQIDVPIVQKLGTKRLEPIKINAGIYVQMVITGMDQSCIRGDMLEYFLTDRIERPNAPIKASPRKPRAPLITQGDVGDAASASKRQKK